MSSVRREKPARGILWSEIRIDEEGETGTGQFQARVLSSALHDGDGPLAATSHIGTINIAFGIHAQQGRIVVMISDILHGGLFRKPYQLTVPTNEGNAEHELNIDFSRWQISRVRFDDIELSEDGSAPEA